MSEADAGGDNGGGGAGDTPAWMNSMPDAYKANEGFAKFPEAADAYAKFDDLLKAEGDALVIPGEDATDDEKNAFFSKMGRPETADGYEVGKPSDWPEGVPYDEGLEAAYKQKAFELGLSGDKAAAMYGWYNELSLKALSDNDAAEKAAMEKATNELKDQWKGDDFKVNTELAHRAYKQYAGEDGMEFIEKTMIGDIPLGDHPMFLKIFADIAKTISDDQGSGDRGGIEGNLSDEDKAKKRFPKTYG